MHPELIAKGQENLGKSKTKGGGLTDFHVTRCGDDLQLILTH
jgi:fructose 1,6-bisphosphate aldolase/phosphatase